MGHFRGTLQGCRGEASRLGSKGSGLRVNAASWEGSVSIALWHDVNTGVDMASVYLATHHSAGVNKQLYRGPISGEEE